MLMVISSPSIQGIISAAPRPSASPLSEENVHLPATVEAPLL